MPTTQEGTHDPERFTHIVVTPGENAQAVITRAQVFGEEVVALCGKRWVPARDPEKHPVCPACKRIRDGLRDDNDS